MELGLREFVVLRADSRCEYCRAHQNSEPYYRFHLEHVIPKQHGGADDEGNLALACPYCNRRKGPNLAGLDPIDGELVRLFNPRMQVWSEHFEVVGSTIIGQTDVGRTTVALLDMNNPVRVAQRGLLNNWPG
jgi:hypothetical protein